MGSDQRRAKRVAVSMSLEVSSLFKQDYIQVDNLNAPIEVQNVSKSGIGFATECVLPIGYYFNARLEFDGDGNALNCVVRILRQSRTEDGRYFYGCEFVGLASIFDYIFEGIELQSEEEDK